MTKFDKIFNIIISVGTVLLLLRAQVPLGEALIFMSLMNIYWVLEKILSKK